jgi:hypothetical protein
VNEKFHGGTLRAGQKTGLLTIARSPLPFGECTLPMTPIGPARRVAHFALIGCVLLTCNSTLTAQQSPLPDAPQPQTQSREASPTQHGRKGEYGKHHILYPSMKRTSSQQFINFILQIVCMREQLFSMGETSACAETTIDGTAERRAILLSRCSIGIVSHSLRFFGPSAGSAPCSDLCEPRLPGPGKNSC